MKREVKKTFNNNSIMALAIINDRIMFHFISMNE